MEVAEARNYLAKSLANLARLHSDRKDWSGARQHMDQGLRAIEAARQAVPLNAEYARIHHLALVSSLDLARNAGDTTGLARGAASLVKAFANDKDDAYLAARATAHAAALAGKDAAAEKFAAQAVLYLRGAVRLGFKDAERIQKDPDLAPLRTRPDFQAIVRELDPKP